MQTTIYLSDEIIQPLIALKDAIRGSLIIMKLSI